MKKKKFVKSYLKFPHIWVLLGIVFLMLVSLGVSVYLDIKSIAFWSSIFANVFASLLTGLVVCLISAVKQIYIFKLETKKIFLAELKNKVLDYSKFYNELRTKNLLSLMAMENCSILYMILPHELIGLMIIYYKALMIKTCRLIPEFFARKNLRMTQRC